MSLTRSAITLCLLVAAPPAGAQNAGVPSCVSSHEMPELPHVVSVEGFPGQRLYLHPKHPRECGQGNTTDCRTHVYVLAGDRVSLAAKRSCDGWTYVVYQGKTSVSSGWVSSRRLFGDSQRQASLPVPLVQSQHFTVVTDKAVCRAALSGNVEDVKLEDIPPYEIPFEALQRVEGSAENKVYSGFMVQNGTVDLINDGHLVTVGIIMGSDNSGTLEWPVVLDEDGLPAAESTANAKTLHYTQKRPGAQSRLFRLGGVTYIEVRSITALEIWRLSATVDSKVCSTCSDADCP
jgi:hypothetical protein